MSKGKLPVTVTMQPDETPLSYVSRLAISNGFETLAEFCKCMDISPMGIESMEPETAELVTELSGISLPTLAAFSIQNQKMMLYGCATVKKTQLHLNMFRYCPNCFSDDVISFGGRSKARSYVRASWKLKAVKNCPIHSSPLLTIPDSKTDHLSIQRDYIAEATDKAQEIQVNACGSYFASRIVASTEASFLDELPYYVAEELCIVLGRMKMRHLKMQDCSVNNVFQNEKFEEPARLMGFEIACCGREGINKFLTEMVDEGIDAVPNPPDLYLIATKWLKPNLENLDYLKVAILFQEHAENSVPLAPGDIFLFEVKERRVFTLATAEKEYGIAYDRIRLILQEHREEFGKGYKEGQRIRVFRRDIVHGWFMAEKATISTAHACERLGCCDSVLNRLIEKKLISYVTNNPNSKRVFRRIPESEMVSLIYRMKERVTLSSAESDLAPITEVALETQFSIADIIGMVLDGLFSRLACPTENPVLKDFYIDPKEIKAFKTAIFKRHSVEIISNNESDKLLPIPEIPKKLSATKITHAELFSRGFLPTTWYPNPKTNRPQRYVTQSDLDTFLKKYVSLNSFSFTHGRHPDKIKKILKENGI